MPHIAVDNTYTQLVRFDVDPAKQEALIAAIAGEVERWVSKRPGFVSSTFHASLDGRNVVNYAQWRDETSFEGFVNDPEGERLRGAIHSVDPSLEPQAIHLRVVRTIEPRP